MNRLPESVRDMSLMAGAERKYEKLSQVRAVQAQISEWITEAAYRRYGKTLDVLSLDDLLAKCWENAQEQWPGIESLVEALNAAERAMWCEEEARA